MIPNERKTDEIFSTAETGSEFVIHQNAAMFSMLSDGLYSDKVGAIVREVACNAYDSHIEAGCEHIPIEITVPNNMTHEFSVEDFGVGMDEETVRSVFAGYFNSSKRDNNEVTGAFGLGSKTPFIFNDTFTIRARKDGRERVFTAYMKDGIPRLSKTSDNDATGVSNGVKITVPVSPVHASRFILAVQDKLRWFKVTPKIVNSDVEIEYDGGISEGEVKLMGNAGGLGVVMGNVEYPVGLHSFFECGLLSDYALNHGWVLRVPMGSVSITPSRESLSLDDETIKTLKNLFTRAYHDFVDAKWYKVIRNSKAIEGEKGDGKGGIVRINPNQVKRNAISEFMAYDYPQSSYGYHYLAMIDPLHTVDHKPRSLKTLAEKFIKSGISESFKVAPKIFHRTDIMETGYGNGKGVCVVNNVHKLVNDMSKHGKVTEFFGSIADSRANFLVTGRYMRKLFIVSHETESTKPTHHIKVIKSFLASDDLNVGTCNHDAVLYIPTMLTDEMKRRLEISLARNSVSLDDIEYCGIEELRKDVPKVKVVRRVGKMSTEEKKERKEKMIVTSQQPVCIFHNQVSNTDSYDLEDDETKYLYVDKELVDDARKHNSTATNIKARYRAMFTLAALLRYYADPESGSNKHGKGTATSNLTLLIKHGNNAGRMDSCGVEQLDAYVARVVGDALRTVKGRKTLDDIAYYMSTSDVIESSYVDDDHMAQVKAVAEGAPKGVIAEIYNDFVKRDNRFEATLDECDIQLRAIRLNALVNQLGELGVDVNWLDDHVDRVGDSLNGLKNLQEFFTEKLFFKRIYNLGWGHPTISQSKLMLELIKSSANLIDTMYYDQMSVTERKRVERLG